LFSSDKWEWRDSGCFITDRQYKIWQKVVILLGDITFDIGLSGCTGNPSTGNQYFDRICGEPGNH
jgi:hypothetical protein